MKKKNLKKIYERLVCNELILTFNLQFKYNELLCRILKHSITMEKRIINFHLYRYHLLPLTNEENQTSLFPEKRMPIKEVIQNKNLFLNEILTSLTESKNNTNPLHLHIKDGDFFIFKIAQKKTTTITKDFKIHTIDDEPYVYIIINNNNDVQKIAISENAGAFSGTDVVKNILSKVLIKELEKHQLNFAIDSMFDKKDFWEYITKYNNDITYINFQFIRPNLARISDSLHKDFRQFAEVVNSHESHITIKAPDKGILENINKDNAVINGLVNYTSEGAGNIKIKVKKIRKHLNTKERPIIQQIDELEIEGAADQVIKLYKSIVE